MARKSKYYVSRRSRRINSDGTKDPWVAVTHGRRITKGKKTKFSPTRKGKRKGAIKVKGYTRSDGVKVKGYTRKK